MVFIVTGMLPAASLWAQADANDDLQTVQMEFFDDPDISSMIHYGNCQWFYPFDQPKETLLKQPDYKSQKLTYYAARYGDAEDNIHTIVLDESQGTGSGYDTVYIDLDNDNQIDPENEKFSFQLGTTRSTIPVRVKLMVSAGGRKIPYAFNFSAFPYKDKNNPIEKVHANARESSIFVGQVHFEGKSCKIAIADLDSNGLFNDTEQGIFNGDRVFIDLDGNGKFDSNDDEAYPYARYTRIQEKWYSIQATPGGTSIQIAPAQPEIGTVTAPGIVTRVDLHSETQSQRLTFSDGSAQAIAGTYRLKNIQLTAIDADQSTWTIDGTYPSTQPQITITPETTVQLSDALPLQVSIEAAGKSPSDSVELKAAIIGNNGVCFGAPRNNLPSGRFEIQDPQGTIVVSEKFEYG